MLSQEDLERELEQDFGGGVGEFEPSERPASCPGNLEPPSGDSPKDLKGPRLSPSEVEKWRTHLQNGHVPYRRDCKQCVEGAGLGTFHRRVKHPRSFALSVDLFGPVPVAESGRDESCVTGKNVLRYGLVGAFRVPRSFVQPPEEVDGLRDLYPGIQPSPPNLEDELADYEPSEAHEDYQSEVLVSGGPLSPPSPGLSPVPVAINAVSGGDEEPSSLLIEEEIPGSDEDLQALIEELRTPVEQVVLRYFIPLRTKSGVEVSEALQRMILSINQRFPVRSIHHDPGTEFASTALSRWLAQHGVRVQHSLPTDKKGNGLSERTVGWVKSRIRTLINSAGLPVGWWPLAARWAVSKHNAEILGEPSLPAFGQTVLHRVKRPADGVKQLMERWIEARYAAPHRSIPDGHVLIASTGNLVASRGFKSDVMDPTKVKELDLPVLQGEGLLDEEEEHLFDDTGNPLRRLKGKTAVRFVECLPFATSEELAHALLIHQDYTIDAIRKVLGAIAQEEDSTGDRRGILDGRQILGAYCHGGLRGATKLTRRKPWTTTFLNRALLTRLSSKDGEEPSSWSAVMLMRAGNVEVHRDWRNEWGTKNFTMHIPGEVQLWVEPCEDKPRTGPKTPVPTWDPSETVALTETPHAFDPRLHHAVRMQPNWLIVGYTPLGTYKLDPKDLMYLESCEFPLRSQQPVNGVVSFLEQTDEATGVPVPSSKVQLRRDSLGNHSLLIASQCPAQVKALSSTSEDTSESSIDSEELQRQIDQTIANGEDVLLEVVSSPSEAQNPLMGDLQPDSNAPIVGWDFSTGNPGDVPHAALDKVELLDYLRVRGAGQAYDRLRALGIQVPNDLQFLFVEDLLEYGFSELLAKRVMLGIHPPGTRRPDNPQNSSLTTGEVRLFDKTNRQIPWIFQNRTLGSRCPGPPLASLGIKQPDSVRKRERAQEEPTSGGRWDDPEETASADPTDSSPLWSQGAPGAPVNPGDLSQEAGYGVSTYTHMMYMQEMWGDEEWVPSAGAASCCTG